MEKNTGFACGSIQPSAPPPTAPPPSAPPSYEEAVAHAANMPHQPMNIPPYPVGPSSMPTPMTYNQPPHQTKMPLPPNYSGPAEPTSQSQTQHSANPNIVPPPEFRIIHQHVTYALGPKQVKMTCPTCRSDIKTTTMSDHQPSAHICCIVLCLLGCCLCSCLPYYMNAFMSVHHFCPNCKNYIGTWKG